MDTDAMGKRRRGEEVPQDAWRALPPPLAAHQPCGDASFSEVVVVRRRGGHHAPAALPGREEHGLLPAHANEAGPSALSRKRQGLTDPQTSCCLQIDGRAPKADSSRGLHRYAAVQQEVHLLYGFLRSGHKPFGHLSDRIPHPTIRHPNPYHLTEEFSLPSVEVHPLRTSPPHKHLTCIGPEPEQLTCHSPLLRTGAPEPVGDAVHHAQACHRVVQGQTVPRRHPPDELSHPRAHLTGRQETISFPTRTHGGPQNSFTSESLTRALGREPRIVPSSNQARLRRQTSQ